MICHRPAKVGEGIGDAFHLAAVVIEAETALDDDPELGVEVEGTGLPVAKELLLNGTPDLPRGPW
jgi:hypothetical protein